MDVLRYCVMDSPTEGPIESLTVASTPRGVCWISFGKGNAVNCSLMRWGKKWLRTDRLEYDETANREAVKQLREYLQNRRTGFDLPLDMHGTPFQLKVWRELLTIPYGETRSYKDIAMGIGATKAVRAIGNANHHNPLPIIVPCHRVIGSNGALVGYGSGLHVKEFLLSLENGKLKELNAM